MKKKFILIQSLKKLMHMERDTPLIVAPDPVYASAELHV